jgi:hypothetical protein
MAERKNEPEKPITNNKIEGLKVKLAQISKQMNNLPPGPTSFGDFLWYGDLYGYHDVADRLSDEIQLERERRAINKNNK